MLNFKNLNTVTAAGSLINSVFYLLVPAFSLGLLGASAGPIGIMNTRAAGACALGMCVVSWLSRSLTDPAMQRIVITGNLAMLASLSVIEIHGTLSGAMNWVGWLFVGADSLLAAGYAVLLKRSWGR
jgi:hypothetical protein